MFFWTLEAAHKLLSDMLLVWERKKNLLVWKYHLPQVAGQNHSKDNVCRFLKFHKKWCPVHQKVTGSLLLAQISPGSFFNFNNHQSELFLARWGVLQIKTPILLDYNLYFANIQRSHQHWQYKILTAPSADGNLKSEHPQRKNTAFATNKCIPAYMKWSACLPSDTSKAKVKTA